MNVFINIFLLGATLCCQPLLAQQRFDAGKAPFSVEIAGVDNSYRTLAIAVLPAEKVPIKLPKGVDIDAGAGELVGSDPGQWFWQAPNVPGLYPLDFRQNSPGEMKINVFVMHPASSVKDGYLRGYRIGEYPKTPMRGLKAYLPPAGFVEVTPENSQTRVSPHFTLGQFVCKQKATGKSKYLVLRPELFIKLERILQETNARGYRSDSLHIMSGYRTPYYNRAIGNKTLYSRHLYGGAADFYIDESPKDGVIDDLNGDGKINKKDAALLYNIVEALSRVEGWPGAGGLGEYDGNANHGPFVHVDSRGYRARWGH